MRDARITRGPDLQRVLKEGKRIRTRFLDVRIATSPLEHPSTTRVGLIVPKVKHTAVERNQLKRRLKELVRQHLLVFEASQDLVILARTETYAASFEMLTQDILRIAAVLN